MSIEEKREKVGYYLSEITGSMQRGTRFQSNEDDLKRLKAINSAVDKIGELIEGSSAEELQEILGGEFSKNYIGGEPFDVGGEEIPAYFLLDVAAGVIDNQCMKVPAISEATQSTLDKMQVLRDKASTLDYDPLFDPEKQVSSEFIGALSMLGTDYSLSVKQQEGIKYLELNIDSQRESVEYKNGEYNSAGVWRYSTAKPLYREDAEAIEEQKAEKIQKRTEKLNSIAEKYFRDGIIPENEEFQDYLLDENLDPRLMNILRSISDMKSQGRTIRDIVTSDVSYANVEKVSYAEQAIEKERMEQQKVQEEKVAREAKEKETAISLARERYREKGFLWKAFHKKQDVGKIDFSNMSTEQISQLYPSRKR